MRSSTLPPDRLRRWAHALGLAALACALQWAVRPWLGERYPFLFFLPAIVVGAAWGGRGTGLLVTAVGCASAWAWVAAPQPVDVVALAACAAVGALLSVVGGRLNVTRTRVSEVEQRLTLAGEHAGIGIFDLNLATGELHVSPALARLAGVDAAAPVPLARLAGRLAPNVVAESRAALAAKLRERATAYERELKMTAADGRVHWLLLRVNLVWVGERAVRLRGACVDITERKAVDTLLERTQAELRQQLADLGRVHELARQLETAALPDQLQQLLGLLAEFHDARRGVAVLYDADTGTLGLGASVGLPVEARARLMQTGGIDGACALACASRARHVIADTEAHGVDPALRDFARVHGLRAVHGTPLVGQDGEALGALSIHLDVARAPTERERALADICARQAATFVERSRSQAALAASQRRFQSVLDASAVPFVVLAPVRDIDDGTLVDLEWHYVNPAAARALRRAPEEFVGRRVLQVLPGRWSDRDSSFAHYQAVVERQETREFESHLERDGVEHWFHCVASPLQGGVALWFSDATERKRAERALQDADRRKDEFLATLAHELRNPLAPIRQAAAVSRLPHATEAQKRWSHEVIDRQVRHMALLLDDLLDVSRITRGALVLRRGEHALADLLDAAVETARPLVDAREHALEIVTPQAAVVMQADALRVAQIVANLLCNAAKYTPPGGRLRLLAALDGDDVVIEVGDNGIGIAAESLPVVFDMFTQLRGPDDDPDVRRADGGLGIGLSLTKGLVELHGGSIAVRSEGRGRGSVFTVRLPRGAAPARASAAPRDVEPRAASARRILVADDNRDAAESLATLLELEGHAVTLAFDGADALAAYARVRPDICLLDIGMPHHDGNAVAGAIRARGDAPAPTLVAITGWGQEHDRQQALAAGFDHHLTKPVDPAALLRLIAQAQAAPLAV